MPFHGHHPAFMPGTRKSVASSASRLASMMLFWSVAVACESPGAVPSPSPDSRVVTTRPVQAATASASQASQVLVVISEGIGPDSRQATEAACFSAIRESVGTLLESEQVVEGDELVFDRIRSRTSGFIRRYDVLEERAEAGLVHARVRVEVVRDQALMVAAEVRDHRAKVSGRKILAKMKSQREALDATSSAIREGLADLVAHAFVASVSEDGILNLVGAEGQGDKIPLLDGRLPLSIVLSVDRDSWNRHATALVTRLGQFGERVGPPRRVRLARWSPLRDPAAHARLDRLAADIQRVSTDPSKVRALLETGDDAPSIWFSEYLMSQHELAIEATVPGLAEQERSASLRTALGKFLSVGFMAVEDRDWIGAVGRGTWPDAALVGGISAVGVLHDLAATEATFSVFRVDPAALAEALRTPPRVPQLSVRMLDAKGTPVREMEFPLTFPGGNLVFVAGAASGGADRLVAILPGRPRIAPTNIQTIRHRTLDRRGPVPYLVDEWGAVLPIRLTEAQLERVEEIEVRCGG